VNKNGERFNDWGGFKGVKYSRQWREQQQAAMNAAASRPGASAEAVGPFGSPRLDQSMNQSNVNATGTVNVNVNAPRGTKVDADADGLFQSTRIKKIQQMPSTDLSEPPGGA